MNQTASLPAYALKAGRFNWVGGTYVTSSPTAPADWGFVNRNGVFFYAKKVYDHDHKGGRIEIRVGNYFGLLDSSVSIWIPNEGISSLPSASAAQRNGFTDERTLVLAAIERVRQLFRTSKGEGLPVYRTFEEWAKGYKCPSRFN